LPFFLAPVVFLADLRLPVALALDLDLAMMNK
jgi:hypothetical protein